MARRIAHPELRLALPTLLWQRHGTVRSPTHSEPPWGLMEKFLRQTQDDSYSLGALLCGGLLCADDGVGYVSV